MAAGANPESSAESSAEPTAAEVSTADTATRRPVRPSLPVALLQYLGLCGLAFALPVLDMLARAPEFFAGHDLYGVGAVLFALTLVVGPPLLLAGLVAASRIAWCAGPVHAVVLFALSFALFAGLLASSAGVLAPGIAAVLAAASVWAVTHRWVASKFATALALPAVLAIGALLVHSPLGEVVAPARSSAVGSPVLAGSAAGETRPLPIDVVILVFDELPLVSLLDPEGSIDGRLYPAFARLAETATWYPNTASPGTHTPHALAGLLTGNLSDGAAPTARAHPENLIAWLAPSHALRIREAGTRFCGAPCERGGVHVGALAADVAILFAHATLPEGLAEWLPPTDERFSDFAGLASAPADTPEALHRSVLRQLRADRARPVRDFIAELAHTPHPMLAYLHVALPHGPFLRLPSGRSHSAVEQLRGDEEIAGDDGQKRRGGAAAAAHHLYHRHLLQLGFADRLLGEVTAALDASGRLRDALVIALADHGRSFQRGEGLRHVTANNLADVLNVPLLVKRPGQTRGLVDPRPATLLDVVATVGDVLGAQPPWPVEGRSLLERAGARSTFRAFDAGEVRSFDYAALETQRKAAVDRKSALFRYEPITQSVVRGVPPFGRRQAPENTRLAAGFLRRRVASGVAIGAAVEASAQPVVPFAYEIDQAPLLGDVHPESGFVPAELTGRLRGVGPSDLALVVNGRVAALARSYQADGEHVFAAMVPEPFFREGRNDVRIALVQTASDGAARLAFASDALGFERDAPHGTLASLRIGEGPLPAPERAPDAEVSVSLIYREAGRFHFGGVARERSSDVPMEQVVLLSDGAPFYWSAPNRRQVYKREDSPYTRFDFVLPASLVTTHLGTEISVAAVPRSQKRLVRGNVSATARCNWGRLGKLGAADFGREEAERCTSSPRVAARSEASN